MKELHEKVNIVPVIGKADTLTPSELSVMKTRVSSRQILRVFFIFKISACQ